MYSNKDLILNLTGLLLLKSNQTPAVTQPHPPIFVAEHHPPLHHSCASPSTDMLCCSLKPERSWVAGALTSVPSLSTDSLLILPLTLFPGFTVTCCIMAAAKYHRRHSSSCWSPCSKPTFDLSFFCTFCSISRVLHVFMAHNFSAPTLYRF